MNNALSRHQIHNFFSLSMCRSWFEACLPACRELFSSIFFSQHFKCMFVSVNFLSSLFAMQATKITASVYTFFGLSFAICAAHCFKLLHYIDWQQCTFQLLARFFPSHSLQTIRRHTKKCSNFFVRFYSWLSTRLSNCFNYNSRSSLLKKIELQWENNTRRYSLGCH